MKPYVTQAITMLSSLIIPLLDVALRIDVEDNNDNDDDYKCAVE